jgi:hypothetical protein
LLIGGPNQSHKVNFKELPDMGKSSNKKDRCAAVNTFFEDFEKTFKPNGELQGTSLRRSAFFASLSVEGSADNVSHGLRLKKFFEESYMDLLSY